MCRDNKTNKLNKIKSKNSAHQTPNAVDEI